MVDVPPMHQEQIIEKKLIDCGLDPQTFSVRYEDDLQSIEIIIRRNSGASKNLFLCIQQAANHEIVTFEEVALQSAFTEFTTELYRPKMIAEATADLKKFGLIEGFPKRSSFESVEAYARALESHCGIVPGSVLKVSGEGVAFDPPRTSSFQRFSKRYEKLLAAIMYASAIGDFDKFGFIGNAAISETKVDQ